MARATVKPEQVTVGAVFRVNTRHKFPKCDWHGLLVKVVEAPEPTQHKPMLLGRVRLRNRHWAKTPAYLFLDEIVEA